MRTIEEERGERASGIPDHPERTASVGATVAGGLTGAVMGVTGGYTGMIVGAVLGAVAGALVNAWFQRSSRRRFERDSWLDHEIGVIGGDMGAPPVARHVPAERRV